MNPLLPLAILCFGQVATNSTENRSPSQVMIVGVFHMNNPGRDLFNFGIKDVLGERRQKEIQEVVTRLERFRPSKIALEMPAASQTIQRRLDDYQSGKYALTGDERDQLGLRLAKLGHSKIYGIDFKEDLDFDSVFQFA